MQDLNLLFETDGIFKTTFGEYTFTYRLLTLREYKVLNGLRASGLKPEWDVYLLALERCSIDDHRLFNRKLPLGMYVSVGQLIMFLSGDCETETLKNDITIARNMYPALSVQERMKHTIFLAFPSYTIDDADKWTRPELIRKFVVAEYALQSRGLGYEPLDIEEIKPYSELLEDTPSELRMPVQDVSRLDFEEDAKEQARANGFWETQEALQGVGSAKKKLTTEQARKLDKLVESRR